MDDDKDWDAFIQATKEPDEEVETLQGEDENLEDEDLKDDDQDESDKGSQDDSKSDESKDKPNDAPKKKPATDESKDNQPGKSEEESGDDEYKPRLTQFFDNGKPNLKKLEEAYINSTQEYENLNTEQKKIQDDYQQLMDVIGKNPEIAEKLFGKDGAQQLKSQSKEREQEKETDPVLRSLKADIKRKNTTEYHDFVKENPDAISDERKDKINRFLAKHSAQYQEDNDGAIPVMKESLEAAYRYYGWEIASEQKADADAKAKAKAEEREKLATAAKKTASSRTSPNSRKQTPKNKANKMEAEFAKNLRVKL